jgi:hypothetical protein
LTSPKQVLNPASPAREQPLVSLPMWKLSACMMAAPKAILFGAALAAPIIWRQEWKPKVAADFWVAVAVYTGGGAGLLFLWCLKPRPVFYWGPLVIASSLIRNAVGLAAAFGLWAAFRPNKDFFWGVFLASMMVMLVVETVVVRNALARASRGPSLAGRPLDDKTEVRAA